MAMTKAVSATRSKKKTAPWGHLGGVDAARDKLIEGVVTPLLHPAALVRLGIRPARGFLIYGPPGVGKSLLARATADAAGAALIEVSAVDVLSQAPGEGERQLRAAFAQAQKQGTALLFVNELDLLAPARIANSAEPQRNEALVNILLAEVDRLADGGNVVVIGASSRPNALDPALMRPGRLDEFIYVPVPDEKGRAAIFSLQLAKVRCAGDVDVSALAARTHRFTPADIEDLIRRAGLHALGRSLSTKKLTMADFDAAMMTTRASVTESMERDYEKLLGEIKQNAMKLEPMGFFAPGQLKPVRDSKHGLAEQG